MGVATCPTARDSKPMPMIPSNLPICLIGFWGCVEGFCACVCVVLIRQGRQETKEMQRRASELARNEKKKKQEDWMLASFLLPFVRPSFAFAFVVGCPVFPSHGTHYLLLVVVASAPLSLVLVLLLSSSSSSSLWLLFLGTIPSPSPVPSCP